MTKDRGPLGAKPLLSVYRPQHHANLSPTEGTLAPTETTVSIPTPYSIAGV